MPVENKTVDKFAFIGPASVGKTTMTGILRNRFAGDPRVALIDEGAKIFFESRPDSTGKSIDTQERLQDFVLAREKVTTDQPGVKLIIADRSVIDPIVYTQVYDSNTHADRLLQRVTDWLPTYTSFILLNPAGVPDDPRPARLETPKERLAIYDVFGEFCETNNLPYVEVSGTIEERATAIQQVLFEKITDKTIFDRFQQNFDSV